MAYGLKACSCHPLILPYLRPTLVVTPPRPQRFVSDCTKMQNKVTLDIYVISLTLFAVILMKKSGGTRQHGSRVSRQSPRVGGWLPPENISNILSLLFWIWYRPKTYKTC